MMPDACFLVFANVCYVRQIFGTRTYSDFMVIVIPSNDICAIQGKRIMDHT